ncbi:alpha/beta fold hydrolase [Microtetraspora fusca]|uniref:Alpha/beta fold hydrolase n=1 Tax=Microtetraspora fusca TaxID=1997 RepID=A0ABW6VBR5_MICFU
MRSVTKRTTALASVAITGVALLGAAPSAAAAAESWCPEVPGHRVECDTITRPLVADRPDLGTISVGYAVVRRSALDRPATGTIAVNPGGPGNPALPLTAAYVGLLTPLLADHDLLLVDPRGTGVSSALDCGITTADLLGTPQERRTAVARCGSSLGPRAGGYTSAATADDLDAVRARLGAVKLDLVGESYGTYLMQIYAQRHPRQVRSIMLSGVLPLDFDTFQRPNARAFTTTLRRICERSKACDGAAAVRDLRTFAAAVRKEPVTLSVKVGAGKRVVKFGEEWLTRLAIQNSTSGAGADPRASSLIGAFPALLHDAARGDFTLLTAAVQQVLGDGGEEPNSSLGISVACNDYPRAWSVDASPAQRRRQYDRALARTAPADFGAFSPAASAAATFWSGDICLEWPRRSATRPSPVSDDFPDVPTLVLTGDLDAITPDSDAAKVARRFTRSRLISVPNLGHVPDLDPSGCVSGIIAGFIAKGTPGPTACLKRIPPIRSSERTARFTRQGNRFLDMVLLFETGRACPSPTSAEGSEKPLPSGSGGVTKVEPAGGM